MRTDMRKLPEDEILTNLRAGKTMTIRRRDDPNLPFLFKLQSEGRVTNRLVQLDEQTSIMKWTWLSPEGDNDG